MKPTRIYAVAILENNHIVEMSAGNPPLKVGDLARTQWGPRKVVAVEVRRDVLECEPELANNYGCYR